MITGPKLGEGSFVWHDVGLCSVTLLPASWLEGDLAHGAEEEERMSVSRQIQPFQCSARICRDAICLHTRRRLTVDKSSLWP